MRDLSVYFTKYNPLADRGEHRTGFSPLSDRGRMRSACPAVICISIVNPPSGISKLLGDFPHEILVESL
jgi:hypothetical protein